MTIPRLPRQPFHVVIVGGGGTGGALAHDLVLRGVRVTLVERGEVTSGTTGRHHGLLHSGARYAVKDQESAVECIEENMILRESAPARSRRTTACSSRSPTRTSRTSRCSTRPASASGIPARRVLASRGAPPGAEPQPRHRSWRSRSPTGRWTPCGCPSASSPPPRRTARSSGPGPSSPRSLVADRVVTGVRVRDLTNGAEEVIHGGPRRQRDRALGRAGRADGRLRRADPALARRAPRRPRPLVQHGHQPPPRVRRRRHHRPQRGLSVVGTSSWVVEDPDDLGVPEDHVERMYREGSKLMPAIRTAERQSSLVGRPAADRLARRDSRARAEPDVQVLRPSRDRRRRGVRHDLGRQGHDAPGDGRGDGRTSSARSSASTRPADPGGRHSSPTARTTSPPTRPRRSDEPDPHAAPETSAPAGSASHRRKQGDDRRRSATTPSRSPLGPSATVLDALVAIRRPAGPHPHVPPLVLPRLVRHVRHAGERHARASRASRPSPAGTRRQGRAARQPPGGRRPRRRHDAFYDDVRRAPGRAARPRSEDLIPECEPAEGVDRLERYEDCIECGICVSACPIAGSDPRYVGPAALAAASRAACGRAARSATRPGPAAVDSEHGVWRCHVAYECTEACPSGVDPAGAIMRLRRAAVAARARRLFASEGPR